MRSGVHQPTYRSWQMMKNRCSNPRAEDYAYYGGRGITFPKTWQTYEGFVAAMGLRPEGLTLDRRNGDKPYSKKNCRWATRSTQTRNRAYTLDITFNGVTRKTWEWAAICKLTLHGFHSRLWLHKQGLMTEAKVFSFSMHSKETYGLG